MTLPQLTAVFVMITLGLSYSGTGRADAKIDARIQVLSQRIEHDPADQSLHLQRALEYVENNQRELALADIQTAETLGDPVEAAFTHGILLYREQDYVSARPYFDRYLQAHPSHWGALDHRARLLRDSGEDRLALADYEALIRLNDALDPGYYVAAARLMAALPERGVDDGIALLDRRMAQRGPLTSLQRCAIDLQRSRGNYQGAIDRMAMLDQRLRATPQWQVEIAELLLLAGRAEEALPYLSVAQEQLQAGRMTVAHRELLVSVQRLQEEVLSAAQANCGGAAQSPCPQAAQIRTD